MNDSAARNRVRIERVVDAPVERVWQLWTDPESFAAWYGPGNAIVTVIEMDVRVGGRRHIGMTVESPNGTMRMWFIGEHLAVRENELLAYSESMADEHGNALPPAALGMPHHPASTTITVELERLPDGTRMVLTHQGIDEDSPGAIGWAMALDKLDAFLRSDPHGHRG